jgi:CHAD domain-containing protein
MSFVVKPARPIRRELERIARRRLQSGRFRAEGDEAVHAARKGVKKARAILTLLRNSGATKTGKVERRLRAAAHTLSALRDSVAIIETYDRIVRRSAKGAVGRAAIRERLVRSKERAARDARRNGCVTQAAAKLTKARRLLKQSHIPPIHRSDIPQLLAASYRASRKAMQAAGRSGSASDLHEWRKRVKTLWYHLRLFESIAPPLRGEIQRLEHLETWLGEHHNLAVLQATIAGDRTLSAQADAVKGATMLFRSAQRTLCRKALDEGRLLFGDSPRKFAARLDGMLMATDESAPAAA